jgi:hypothetical protein
MEEAVDILAVLKPFAEAARQFSFSIGPDGIDDALTIEAIVCCRSERIAVLSTADFSAAKRAHDILAVASPPPAADNALREAAQALAERLEQTVPCAGRPSCGVPIFGDQLEALRAALSLSSSALGEGWQDIASAPKGVSVLVVVAAKPCHPYLWEKRHQDVHEAAFEDDEWYAGSDRLENEYFHVTHWQPLPQAPKP